MKKISDRILLGTVCGLISGIPGRLLNNFEYHKGLTDVKYGQILSGLFFPKVKANKNEGKLVGYIANQINLGLAGVIITYLLSATGRDKAILKGIGVTATAWLFFFGITSRLGTNVKNKNAPLLSFIDHLILGSLCGLLTSKLGSDALFPDINNDNNKLSLLSSNTKQE